MRAKPSRPRLLLFPSPSLFFTECNPFSFSRHREFRFSETAVKGSQLTERSGFK